ncbi:MAG TPA: CBS domain-containing protein [Acidobacteriota bacterium]|nr:CBS domain-containing protein [Acidobacteriota bacterium]
MGTVRDLLKTKGQATWRATPNSTVYEALRQMAEKNVGALLVMEGDRVVGIFSERDYARKVMLKGKFSAETFVREVMTENLITIAPHQSIEECMELMTNKHIRHLPVMEDGKLIGVISIGDVVKSIIEDQKATITHLEGYIIGR